MEPSPKSCPLRQRWATSVVVNKFLLVVYFSRIMPTLYQFTINNLLYICLLLIAISNTFYCAITVNSLELQERCCFWNFKDKREVWKKECIQFSISNFIITAFVFHLLDKKCIRPNRKSFISQTSMEALRLTITSI